MAVVKMGLLKAVISGLTIALLFAVTSVRAANAQVESDFDGMVIAGIYVNNQNVFDQDDDRENGFIYLSANYLHIKTQNEIIKNQLLFKEGEVYSLQKVRESERILRSNNYIRDATISASASDDNLLVFVTTIDTWSTKPTFSFGRVGGKNKSEIGIEEENLFGRGIHLQASYRSDIDRSSENLKILDNNFFGSRYRAMLEYSNLSDGELKALSLEHPFFSLDTQSAHGFSFRDLAQNEGLYFQGDKYVFWDEQEKESDFYWGWSKGMVEDKVFRHRLGLHYFDKKALLVNGEFSTENQGVTNYASEFTLPTEIKEIYPYYSFDYAEDRYDTATNLNLIARTEDRYLGTGFGMRVGYISKDFGSSDNYLKVDAYLSKNKQLSDSLFLTSEVSLDLEYLLDQQEVSNSLFNYNLKLYAKQPGNFRFYAEFSGSEAYKLRYDRQLFLDENAGFRGYPLRYFSGESMKKLSLEQRYYFKGDLWRIFNFGAAAFVDIGQISGGTDFEQEQSGIYKTVGLGLRITSNRSSQGNIVHFDLSKPLDAPDDVGSWQLSVSSKTSF